MFCRWALLYNYLKFIIYLNEETNHVHMDIFIWATVIKLLGLKQFCHKS